MTVQPLSTRSLVLRLVALFASLIFVQVLMAQEVTYFPYIQPGDNGPLGATDQVLIAWQTNEIPPGGGYQVSYGATTNYGLTATPSGRVVDNYLAADPSLPVSPFAYGAHSNYT